MKTWLLGWNSDEPAVAWLDIEKDIQTLNDEKLVGKFFLCGIVTGIQPGDRIFVVHLGKAVYGVSRGIIGSGWAQSKVYYDVHPDPAFAEPNEKYNQVEVLLDVIINPRIKKNRILFLDQLHSKIPNQNWQPKNGVLQLSNVIASKLEQEWKQLLVYLNLTQHASFEEVDNLSKNLGYNDLTTQKEIKTKSQKPTPINLKSSDNPEQNDSEKKDPNIINLLRVAETDILAGELENTDPTIPGFLEGQQSKVLVNKYERDARNRALAIFYHGTTCKVCGFNFEHVYGSHGKNYIEVHHKRPISSYGGNVRINPKEDLTVLCSNCHRMIHRNSQSPLTLEQLSKVIESAKKLDSKN